MEAFYVVCKQVKAALSVGKVAETVFGDMQGSLSPMSSVEGW
jgi:hypothetical protein